MLKLSSPDILPEPDSTPAGHIPRDSQADTGACRWWPPAGGSPGSTSLWSPGRASPCLATESPSPSRTVKILPSDLSSNIKYFSRTCLGADRRVTGQVGAAGEVFEPPDTLTVGHSGRS